MAGFLNEMNVTKRLRSLTLPYGNLNCVLSEC